ncbi:MAG TPA: DoxX family protein [Pseudolabrys sp.]|nr:DoxX family protein [Pseudolabrys sp.]
MTMHSGTTHPTLSHTDSIAASWTDTLLLVGRILLGWIFLTSGFGKLASIAGTTAYFAARGLEPASFWAWFGGLYEFAIGALLILGVATRYAALATILWVVMATIIAHRYWTYPVEQQSAQYINFMKNLAIIGGAIYVFVFGAGKYAVDTLLARR